MEEDEEDVILSQPTGEEGEDKAARAKAAGKGKHELRTGFYRTRNPAMGHRHLVMLGRFRPRLLHGSVDAFQITR